MTGALRFEARARVLPTGGTREATGDTIVIRGADVTTAGATGFAAGSALTGALAQGVSIGAAFAAGAAAYAAAAVIAGVPGANPVR